MIEEAKKILVELWERVISENTIITLDPRFDKLINSTYVSIRYCLPTQILGKLVNNQLDCLCLQKGNTEDTRTWDPRGFCTKVIVPWVNKNQNILGSSTDPYVSKPLRKKRLDADPTNVKGKEDWKLLYKVLKEIEDKSSVEFTKERLLKVLASIYKEYQKLIFEYYLPERISLVQTINLIEKFLSDSSGGDRGLAVTAAIFETFGKHFNLYKEIKRQVINASDSATGLAADIECIGIDGEIKLAIEVKERKISIIDVRSSILKARKVSINEIILNTPGIVNADKSEISDLVERTWASGTNIYFTSIGELIRVGITLTGEEGRNDLLNYICKQLDTYNTQPINRLRWKELLEEI